jgi:hypothetical protein
MSGLKREKVVSCLECGCYVTPDVGLCDECREQNWQNFITYRNDLIERLETSIQEEQKCEAMMRL